MVTVTASVSSSSPYGHSTSPYSLSFLLEQQHNQCVPASPSLSPFLRHGPLSQQVLARGSSPVAAQVPELGENSTAINSVNSGSRVYSGSPLLRQIFRAGRKRQCEVEGSSPLMATATTTPSPIAQSSKRARLDSPGFRVPNSVIIIERKANHTRTRASSMEQVVPGMVSPLERRACGTLQMEGNDDSSGYQLSGCQRTLPPSKEGVKPLDLFSGDEIFARHEE